MELDDPNIALSILILLSVVVWAIMALKTKHKFSLERSKVRDWKGFLDWRNLLKAVAVLSIVLKIVSVVVGNEQPILFIMALLFPMPLFAPYVLAQFGSPPTHPSS